jgi:isopenicillin N synthase-like dioxygenase
MSTMYKALKRELMIKNNKKSQKEVRQADDIQSKFESLPLEQKLSNLFKMEMVTITEAINYVTEIEKIGNVAKDFGSRIEKEVREAASGWKPAEEAKPNASGGSGRRRSSSKPASPAV